MSLPKINTPEYRLTIPSTDEEIKFRPFLVQEEKLLLIAQQTGDQTATYDAIRRLIENCCFGQLDIERMPLFDMEYIFINIRAKSVGEIADLKVTCPDDGKTQVDIQVDLTKINVEISEEHSAQIKLNDEISFLMAYPHMGMMTQGQGKDNIEAMFDLICDCMYQIYYGEEIYDCLDYTQKEKMDFLNSLTHDQFEKIQKFFDTMPKLKHDVEVVNPKTKKKSTVELEGINSFF